MSATTIEDLKTEIRQTDLLDRLNHCQSIISGMATGSKHLRISVPAHPADDDIFITTTLEDALHVLKQKLPEPIPALVQNRPLEALRLRVKALYHNCMSASCFCTEDAEKAEMSHDKTEALAKRRESSAYSTAAGWLLNATK